MRAETTIPLMTAEHVADFRIDQVGGMPADFRQPCSQG